jgi:hypothetical protein
LSEVGGRGRKVEKKSMTDAADTADADAGAGVQSNGAALSVFVGTWNVGNVAPQMDACHEWLAAARGHHIIAIAAQEASYPHSRSNLSPKTVSSEMRDVPYHVKRLGWLRSSKITRFGGAVAGAMAGGVAAGPFAPVGMVVGAAAGYYSSTKVSQELKVRAHWLDVVKAAVGPGYRVVQTAALLQMRIAVLCAEPMADLVTEVRVGSQATGILNTIGNKGGLMVRVVLEGGESIAFVAVHLAAHEGARHVQARNDSLSRIFQGCWETSTVRKLGGGTSNGHVEDDMCLSEVHDKAESESQGKVKAQGTTKEKQSVEEIEIETGRGDGVGALDGERSCSTMGGSSSKGGVISRVAATAAAVAQEATNRATSALATVQEAASSVATMPSRRSSSFSSDALHTGPHPCVQPSTSGSGDPATVSGESPRSSERHATSSSETAVGSGAESSSMSSPPPLELLACTSHVFVFGDLNYRLDPGVVTGRGWNTMWKKGGDASSGSIAAAVAAVATGTNRTKKKSTKAAFAAADARKVLESSKAGSSGEEDEDDEEERDESSSASGLGMSSGAVGGAVGGRRCKPLTLNLKP